MYLPVATLPGACHGFSSATPAGYLFNTVEHTVHGFDKTCDKFVIEALIVFSSIDGFLFPSTTQVQVEENPFTIILITFGSLIGFLSCCALALLVVQKLFMWHINREVVQVRPILVKEHGYV